MSVSIPVLGVEIGGTKLQVVAGSSSGIVDRHYFTVDPAAGAEGIRGQIASVLPDLLTKHHPVAVGAGFGGPVDSKNGVICCSNQIAGWSDFSLGEWLARQTGLPARVDNDAAVAALAEAWHGAGAGANPVFYVTLGSGVGGGLVVEGEIYHGAVRGQAEIGHLWLDREGTTVESVCSGWAVDRRIREARSRRPESLLFQLAGADTRGEAQYLAKALAAGDALGREILLETAESLAFGLSHVAHLMHPEIIILGGGLSLVGEPLRAAVEEALPPFLLKAFRPGPRIELSALKRDAVPLGALLLGAQAAQI
jgi:glucokinase